LLIIAKFYQLLQLMFDSSCTSDSKLSAFFPTSHTDAANGGTMKTKVASDLSNTLNELIAARWRLSISAGRNMDSKATYE
jgi:hypothetical protein